ncbi:MAG: molybdenum cofactor biosynthesis protein MoaE [Candidatus Helarchaeota archaeon]
MTGIYKKGTITLIDLINKVKQNPRIDEAGAIVTFTGIVRGLNSENKKVEHLEIDSYEEMADKILKKIAQEEINNGIIDIQIAHMIGDFSKGEDLVYIVILGAHRKECFETLKRVVDRYKSESPLWKKEFLESGESYWIGTPTENSE